jgi:hypothetical protein
VAVIIKVVARCPIGHSYQQIEKIDAKAPRCKELREKRPKKPLRFLHSWRSLRQTDPFLNY